RINHEHIPGMQLSAAFTKFRVRHDAEWQAPRSQLLHRSSGMHYQGWIVAGVEKGQATTLRIEFRIKERDETIRWDAFRQVTINRADGLDDRIVVVGLRVHGGVQ